MFSSWKHSSAHDGYGSERRQVFDPVTAKTASPRACEACRTRKVRCTGGREGCERCRTLGRECVYTHRPWAASRWPRDCDADAVPMGEAARGLGLQLHIPQNQNTSFISLPRSNSPTCRSPASHGRPPGDRIGYPTAADDTSSPVPETASHDTTSPSAGLASIYEAAAWETVEWPYRDAMDMDPALAPVLSSLLLDEASLRTATAALGMDGSLSPPLGAVGSLTTLDLAQNCHTPSEESLSASLASSQSSRAAGAGVLDDHEQGHGQDQEHHGLDKYTTSYGPQMERKRQQPQSDQCPCLHRIVLLMNDLDLMGDGGGLNCTADRALAIHKAALQEGPRMLDCSSCRDKVEHMTLLTCMADKVARLCCRLAAATSANRVLSMAPNTSIGAYRVDSPLEYTNLVCSLLDSHLHHLRRLVQRLQYHAAQFRSDVMARRVMACNNAIGEAQLLLDQRSLA